ncbi:DMT family transporter [Pseudoalteromonas obscura]|uniref:DMT family transporter n=1 Tax=Pseudoalteromonas obscura TaxID=3048491 RepID=A0ABT7EPL6_9GAMM|nr:DMT family transporter [Pseudoalteromonas sp. P94(2023)]MDK2596930.1 DMT family transporter [Pseudoalteromonas sp. P94(2023)]
MSNAYKPAANKNIEQLKLFTKTMPNYLKGVMLALISCGLFVYVSTIVRTLSTSIGEFEILLFRQFVFIVLLLPTIFRNIDTLRKPQYLSLHIIRIIGAFFALYLSFITLRELPLATAIAISFTSVLFVALLSTIFLSEKLTVNRWATVIIGFIGVMLIVQPNFNGSKSIYFVLGLCGALGAATTSICIKKIVKVESSTNLLVYQAVFIAIITLVPTVNNWVTPTFEQAVLLLIVGAISSLAQWIGVTAFKYGDANVIANVQYSNILYSLLFGYFLFQETPNFVALAGCVVLIISVCFGLLRKTN